METDSKNYEFPYLLPPSIPESEVLMYSRKLSKIIEDTGGKIRHTEEPKKGKLAYEIKKEGNAYFGWTTFAMAPNAIALLEKKLKGENLLRFLIVGEEETQVRPQILRTIPSRPAPTHIPAHRPEGPEKPEEKLDLEALDKKLEEILGK